MKMKHLEINDNNLELFLENIRNEDKAELDLGIKSKKDFFNLIKKLDDVDFISIDGLKPLAIGGVRRINENKGQIWLLCTKEYRHNKKALFKYLDYKINLYKKQYAILFNYIFKSNFKILAFLEKRGFKTNETNNSDFKLFYFKKITEGEKIDI